MAISSTADESHIQEVKLQRLQGGQTSIYFASIIASLILVFASTHWSRRLYHRLRLEKSSWGRSISKSSRPLSRYLYGQKFGSITVLPERVALAIVYFGLNVGVSFWDIDWHHYTTFANRLGWSVFNTRFNKPIADIHQGFITQHGPGGFARAQEYPFIAHSWTLLRNGQCLASMVWIYNYLHYDGAYCVSER